MLGTQYLGEHITVAILQSRLRMHALKAGSRCSLVSDHRRVACLSLWKPLNDSSDVWDPRQHRACKEKQIDPFAEHCLND